MTKSFHQYSTSEGIWVYTKSTKTAESFFAKQADDFNAVWNGTTLAFYNYSAKEWYINGRMLIPIKRGIYVAWHDKERAEKAFNLK